jgi:hypothetical protein
LLVVFEEFRPGALPQLPRQPTTSFLTAFGNGCGFAGIFERQAEALVKPKPKNNPYKLKIFRDALFIAPLHSYQ